MKGLVMAFLVIVGAYATFDAAQAQSSCKVCADQQKACMKNYGGPTPQAPLFAVTIGFSAALESMQGNRELTKLRADVERMNRLVDQLLRVARLDSVALDFEAVDLNEIASSVVATMAPWAIGQERSVGFVGAEGPAAVKANGAAVADAIRNLIENAVLHSPPSGEVVVTVQSSARVIVADRGCGVPPADRERIFDRFWRGKWPKTAGAGLGLAIVRETMRAHGGDVVVSDNPGGGALFTLAFPERSQIA